ncbi:MAG: DegV family protein [Anaerolineales bacterium]
MEKKKFAVLSDSTAGLPDDLREKYAIKEIPLIVNWDDESYLDNVDITPDEFYAKLAVEKNIPTTSQPSAGAFKDVYEAIASEADGVLALLISADLSGTVASAIAAKEMVSDFPVKVVDTRLTTMALGLVALKAAEIAEEGASIEDALHALAPAIEGMKVMFVVDTLEFLHRGGRIGGAQRLLGSMLAMKPVLQLVDGKIESLESVRTKKKAIQTMLSVFEADAVGKDKIHMTVFHGVAEDDAENIRRYLEETFHPDTLIVAKLSPVIGVHTGPGTVGIAYYFE